MNVVSFTLCYKNASLMGLYCMFCYDAPEYLVRPWRFGLSFDIHTSIVGKVDVYIDEVLPIYFQLKHPPG